MYAHIKYQHRISFVYMLTIGISSIFLKFETLTRLRDAFFTVLEVLLCCGSHFDCAVTACAVVFWRGGNDGMSGRDSNRSKPVLSEAAGLYSISRDDFSVVNLGIWIC